MIACTSYTMVCLPVRGDNPQALANGLSPIHVDTPWYNYFIPPLSVQTLFSMKYFVLKFAISGNGSIKI